MQSRHAVGAVTMLVFAPPMILALLAAGITGLETMTFVWFKGIYAGAMAAMVQPVVALWAIQNGGAPEAELVADPSVLPGEGVIP